MQPNSIVAVVESPLAIKDVALTRALALAQWYESDLHVVHAGAPRDIEDTRQTFEQSVADVARTSSGGNVNIVSEVLSGAPVAAIANYSRDVDADLLVVGRRARRTNRSWFAGSFAAAIGKAVQAPTIAVPNGAQRRDSNAPFRNIVAAVDFSQASFGALTRALTLAQESGGRLTLLHVLDGFPYESVYSGGQAFRLVREFRARVEQVNRELRSLIPADALHWAEIDVTTMPGRAHEAIIKTASDRRADLIVLGLPNRPRVEEFVAGSTVHRVVRRTVAPVLLVPGPSTSSLFRPTAAGDLRFMQHPPGFGAGAIAGPASGFATTTSLSG